MDRTATPATAEDAKLIIHLYELRRDPRMREARDWFVGNFHAETLEEMNALCPMGSEPHASYRMVTSYWEMAASFVNHGALHRDLFFENNPELLLVWERIRTVVPLFRQANSNPKALANFERLADEFVEWWEERAPGAHAAFAARMNAIPLSRKG